MTPEETRYKINELLSPIRDYADYGEILHKRQLSWLQNNLKIEQYVTEEYGQTKITTNLMVKDFNGQWQSCFEQPQDIAIKKPQRTLPYTTDLGFTIPSIDIDQNS